MKVKLEPAFLEVNKANLATAAADPNQGLDADHLAQIDAIVERTYGAAA
jgi:hypothetical protein